MRWLVVLLLLIVAVGPSIAQTPTAPGPSVAAPAAKAPAAQTPTATTPTGPAPRGDAVMVARRVIGGNFPYEACPAVARSVRHNDQTITATCSNGNKFRIYSIRGDTNVVNCSASARMGIDC